VALRLVIIVASRFALRDGLRQRGRTFLLLTQHLFLIPARRDSETYRATIRPSWRDWFAGKYLQDRHGFLYWLNYGCQEL
jgi:hypothetical protein